MGTGAQPLINIAMPTCKILVVGRAGQLASDLAIAAGTHRIQVTTAGRPDLDIADPQSIARHIASTKPDVVINASAYTNVDKAESEPDLCMAVNRDGPGHLASACKAAGIPLVHVSTDMVFPDVPGKAFAEDDQTGPLGVYGLSKLEGEKRVAAEHDRYLIARVSWVYGPSGDNFVKKILTWAKAKPELSIVADQIGRPTYSPDLAEALLVLAGRMVDGTRTAASVPHGILHIAGCDVLPRDEQARIAMAASAARGGPSAAVLPVPTSKFPTPARRALNATLSVDKAANLYGIRLGHFKDDVERMLDTIIGPRKA